MKEQEKVTNEAPVSTGKACRAWRTRVIAWTLGALMGGMAVGAVSQAGMGHFCGPFGHGPFSERGAEAVEERRQWIGFGIERMLSRVDASDEQKAQVKGIADRLATDMQPLREQFSTNRKELVELLIQPEVDRAGIEALRSRQLAQMDEMSRQLVVALGDAAAVLTPEQRAQLAERFERFRR